MVKRDLYLIDQGDTAAYRELVGRCRMELNSTGCCSLLGFLTAEAQSERSDRLMD